MPEDDRIFEIATDLIHRSSIRYDLWKVTSLAPVHAIPPLPLTLEAGERVLVCAQFPEGDWYAWTTRQLVSSLTGRICRMPSPETAGADFGGFTGPTAYLKNPAAPLQSLIATIHGRNGEKIPLRYELGYASMAPIQCHQFWMRKYPILHQLLMPPEGEERELPDIMGRDYRRQ